MFGRGVRNVREERTCSARMKKVAIVGVEGAGKTVMLAGLGELYSHPDADGYFFEPKGVETVEYVRAKTARLRSGRWPEATSPDALVDLGWTIKKSRKFGQPKSVCKLDCLDFAGEVYLSAFGGKPNPSLRAEESRLRQYIKEADSIVLLVNLRDAISHGGDSQRAAYTEYASLQLLKSIIEGRGNGGKYQRVLIALSQADAYQATIESCGGPKKTLERYLPLIANSFGWLNVIAVSAVGKTVVTDEGSVAPAPDYTLDGLKPMIRWILHPPFDARRINLLVRSMWVAFRRIDWLHLHLNLKFAIFASLCVEVLLYFWMRSASGFVWFLAWLGFLLGGCVGCGVGWLMQVADHFKRLNGVENHLLWERAAGVIIAVPLITLGAHIVKWIIS